MTPIPLHLHRIGAPLFLAFMCAGATAAPLDDEVLSRLNSFVLGQVAGGAGRVSVQIDAPRNSALPPCALLQPFLPRGVAAWGRFSLGVRCAGERPWTRFLAARVTVEGTYLAASHAIQAGQALSGADGVERTGDLTQLPRNVVTHPAQLVGTIASNGFAAGAPLRSDLVKGAAVIQQGQSVRIVARGEGFVASIEGRAVTSASAGAVLQVKTPEGRLLSGVADREGIVRIGP